MSKVEYKKFEYTAFTCVLFLTIFGLLVLYAASNNYLFFRQCIFCVTGILIALFLSFINYKIILKFSNYIFITCFILVIVTAFAGRMSRGSSRWIELQGIIFQPSELMKLAIILYLSKILAETKNMLDNRDKFVKVMLVAYLPSFVTALNNLSTGLIMFFIATCMIFIVSKKYFIFLVLIGLIVLFYMFAQPMSKVLLDMGLLKEYQAGRIFAWKDPTSYPDTAYQTLQGLYAIGSGKLTGRGYLSSMQKSLIPESQNDMIFCILCEELGFIGAMIFIVLYVILIFRIFYVAFKAKNLETILLTFGIAIHITFQIILNIGVVTNLLPNTGVTLPFVSYGGSSLLVLFVEIGIFMSIVRYSET